MALILIRRLFFLILWPSINILIAHNAIYDIYEAFMNRRYRFIFTRSVLIFFERVSFRSFGRVNILITIPP